MFQKTLRTYSGNSSRNKSNLPDVSSHSAKLSPKLKISLIPCSGLNNKIGNIGLIPDAPDCRTHVSILRYLSLYIWITNWETQLMFYESMLLIYWCQMCVLFQSWIRIQINTFQWELAHFAWCWHNAHIRALFRCGFYNYTTWWF